MSANLPLITGTLTIDGRRRTIDGMDQYRIFAVEAENAHLTVHDITLTQAKGDGSTWGSAVRLHPSSDPANRPSVTLNRVRISDSSSAAGGGASCIRGDMSISDSVISGNSASTFGGGIAIGRRCVMTVSRSAIHGNSAPDGGGGISAEGQPNSITVTNSTIYNNSTNRLGGGIYLVGDVIVNNGIQLLHLTITGNSAGEGGAFDGAGIASTTYNSGRHLRNSIIWGNSGNHQCNAVNNGFTVFENNIIQASAGNTHHCGTGASNADPRLPASPTGHIPYFPLPDGSPAIDAAGDCSALTTEDQRGRSRPYPAGGRCDVGAYEWHTPPARESGGGGSGSGTGATGMATTCETLPANVMVANRGAGTQCQQVSGAGIGVAELVEGGAREAVDVWNAVSSGTKVCFAATSGDIQFLDAAGAPRSPETLPVFSEGGMLCATIDRPGTAVLMPGPAAPAPEEQAEPEVALATADAGQGLSNCMVRTTHILNLRQGPDGAILGLVPFDVTLTAFQRNDGWYEVDYLGARGWISAGYVTPQGDCG